MMLSVSMASHEGNDDAVMSYAGLIDRDTIQGRDVQLLDDDDVVDEVAQSQHDARRERQESSHR